MSLPTIIATEPVIEGRTIYNQMWPTKLVLDLADPNEPGRMCFLLQQCAVAIDGRAQLATSSKPTRVDIEDVLAVAHSRPALRAALDALMIAIAEAADLSVVTPAVPLVEKVKTMKLAKPKTRRQPKRQSKKAKPLSKAELQAQDERVKGELIQAFRNRSKLLT